MCVCARTLSQKRNKNKQSLQTKTGKKDRTIPIANIYEGSEKNNTKKQYKKTQKKKDLRAVPIVSQKFDAEHNWYRSWDQVCYLP